MTTERPAYEIAAYFPEWGVRQPYYVKTLADRRLAEKITIINYAFGFPGPDSTTGEIVCQLRDPAAAYQQTYTAEMSVDGEGDAPDQPLRGHFNQLRKLKARYPHLKVVVSLGGWTDSTWFSDAACSPEGRRTFVASCIDLYIHGNLPMVNGAGGQGAGKGVFDGIDIDWEYPIGGGLPDMHNRPEDGENFVLLLQEFRKQYEEIGRPDLLLTAAVPGPAQARQFNMPQAHPYLDLVALMTYDLRGDFNPITGHHTNLYNSDMDPAPETEKISADTTIRLYRDELGVPAEKILIGAAFYGRGWKEVGPENNGLFQPGKPMDEGVGNFNKLQPRIGKDFVYHWDASAQAPWLYNPAESIFVTYDDPRSVALKTQYVKDHHLGGVMFWEITGDDAQGTLVNTIYNGLQNQ